MTVGGHFGEVVDMQWEPGGQFLLSVSTDQTTRLHAPWIREGSKEVNVLFSYITAVFLHLLEVSRHFFTFRAHLHNVLCIFVHET